MFKNIGVSQSDRLARKIHQNAESLKFFIRQNNVDREFVLNLTSHGLPLRDSRRNKSHPCVTGVPEGYFFRKGLLWALPPTSAPVQRALSPSIALTATTTLIATTAFTATTTLIAATTLRFTTLRLTPNCPMGVIAWGIQFTGPKGAIGGTPINMVVHISWLTMFPMFGTRHQNGLIERWRFRPGVGGFLRRGLG